MATPCYDEVWRDVYGDLQVHGPAHRHLRRLLAGVVGGLPYASVLDVGCGAGDNVALLCAGRAPAPRFVGADVSDEALRRARERHPEGEYLRLDVQAGALDERFDLVFSSLVLEHLPDDAAALRNLHAMTGRWLVLATVGGDYERHRPWEEQVGHVRNYAPGELEARLGDAGFAVERMVRWGFPLYSPLARRLQNRMRAEPSYSLATRLVARATYALYFLNSARRGDLLIALATPRSESSRERAGA